jgi:quercetin dioxygenase-like cupin family protein
VRPHEPVILSSSDAARIVAIELPAGERLDEHRVHERTFLTVVRGEIELADGIGQPVIGGPGMFAEFDPGEVHEVRAIADSRILLTLAPWPGEGHPGAMTLEEKARARETARAHASS